MRYTYNDLLKEIQKIPEHRRGSLIDASLGDDGDTYYVISLEEMREEQGVEHQADIEKLTKKTNEFEIDDILGDDGFELGPDVGQALLLGPVDEVDEDTLVLGPAEEEPEEDELTFADDEALMLPPELVDEVDLFLALEMGDEPPKEKINIREKK